ncbi:Type IV secretion system protein virB5 [Ralstonia psammae]|uniref:Type IV secretion system protein virB5 n=1 Tax=Ralstonia psammae TaxID=3058598 RepID=A0ABM9JYT3_9RALS|nr:P-type DNA transfer protein VirB5 [Ralstonia sp. LMG 19083]CAJ0807713.1 Type IV secretion system protein virB5 [Ralstonia sp. LMG 19083]
MGKQQRKLPLRPVIRHALVALASAMYLSNASATGIPVLDVSNLGQAMLMVQNLKAQIDQLKSQYDAVTGNRGYGTMLNDPALRSYLPDQWQSIYDQVRGGSLQGISSAALQIAKAEGMTGAATPGQQRYYDVIAANKAMAMQAYNATLGRLNNIQALMQQSNLTQDPAAKADLQNRWAAEYTMVQNEQTRLNLMSRLQETELRLAQEQRHREFKNNFLRTDQ